MNWLRGLAILVALITFAWITLIVMLMLVETFVLRMLRTSLLRTGVGLILYSAWAACWYIITVTVVKQKIKK